MKYTDNGQQWRGAEAKADVCNLNATLKGTILKKLRFFFDFRYSENHLLRKDVVMSYCYEILSNNTHYV